MAGCETEKPLTVLCRDMVVIGINGNADTVKKGGIVENGMKGIWSGKGRGVSSRPGWSRGMRLVLDEDGTVAEFSEARSSRRLECGGILTTILKTARSQEVRSFG